MEYNSLLHAIPVEWKHIVNKNDVNIEPPNSVKVHIDRKCYAIGDIKCKHLYHIFISKINKPPTAVTKWCEIYNIDYDLWSYYFTLAFNVCIDTELQTFQFKIIHRFFPCNYTLSLWYNDVDNMCQFCVSDRQLDSIQHYFYHCTIVANFWYSFIRWWKNITGFSFVLDEIDIIFGILNPFKDNFIDVLNYCILLGKFYIYTCKKDGTTICMFEFLILLKNRIEVLNMIYTLKGHDKAFQEKWSFLYDNF